jgi:hypothetical protein
MNSLTVAVPPEQQSDVDSWADGEQYNLVVKQTGPGQFELVSSSDAEGPNEDKGETDETDGGAAPGDMHDNPAVAVVMMKKKGA